MSFTIRLQRTHPLATPEDLRNDSHLQSIAAIVRDTYQAKNVPTTPEDVRSALLGTFAEVDLEQGPTYAAYIHPVTGEIYYCCIDEGQLTVSPSAPNPVVVRLSAEALIP